MTTKFENLEIGDKFYNGDFLWIKSGTFTGLILECKCGLDEKGKKTFALSEIVEKR